MREPDPVVCPPWPQPSELVGWKSEFRASVAAASAFPRLALKWICEVEKAGAKQEDFTFGWAALDRLDRKVAQAVIKMIRNNKNASATLGTRINTRQELLAKDGLHGG